MFKLMKWYIITLIIIDVFVVSQRVFALESLIDDNNLPLKKRKLRTSVYINSNQNLSTSDQSGDESDSESSSDDKEDLDFIDTSSEESDDDFYDDMDELFELQEKPNDCSKSKNQVKRKKCNPIYGVIRFDKNTHWYCDTCRKNFKNTESSYGHVRNHHIVRTKKGRKPRYYCNLCGSYISNIGNHIWLHHLRIPRFLCTKCEDETRFYQSGDLQRHYKNFHTSDR